MMEVSAETPQRRRRYTPTISAPQPTMTPNKCRLLETVGSFGFVSLPQLARLTGLNEKATRRQMRPLFDAGLVEIIAVHRAALTHEANTAQLLGGSAPNIFRLTRAGSKLLTHLSGEEPDRVACDYGPKNAFFLAHELAIRDIRIWLELITRQESSRELLRWHMGESAWMDLKRESTPTMVRPDAWFVLKIGTSVLVGLAEVDRATERGVKRWKEKLTAYTYLFQGERLKAATGYQNARILVITPTPARRDHLAALLLTHASPDIARRFWLADQSVLDQTTLEASVWRQPGSQLLRPLITPAHKEA
jgi:hypothetical protein